MQLPEGYTNPFSILFKGLESTFKQNPLVRQCIRPGNFVVFDGVLGLKTRVQHGDLPEMVIVPNGHSQEDMGTSATGRVSENYRVFISTDDRRMELVHAFQWEIYRCLETFNAQVASTLLYKGEPFIEILKMGSGTESMSISETNRGINGWCAVWDFTVAMYFPHEVLQFEYDPEYDPEKP